MEDEEEKGDDAGSGASKRGRRRWTRGRVSGSWLLSFAVGQRISPVLERMCRGRWPCRRRNRECRGRGGSGASWPVDLGQHRRGGTVVIFGVHGAGVAHICMSAEMPFFCAGGTPSLDPASARRPTARRGRPIKARPPQKSPRRSRRAWNRGCTSSNLLALAFLYVVDGTYQIGVHPAFLPVKSEFVQEPPRCMWHVLAGFRPSLPSPGRPETGVRPRAPGRA